MRDERRFGAFGELLDVPRGFDVLGEIEIVRARAFGGVGHRVRQMIGRRGKHDVMAFDFVAEFSRIADVHLTKFDTALVRHALETGPVAICDGDAIVAGA